MPIIEYNGEKVEIVQYGRGGSRLIRHSDGREEWIHPDYSKKFKQRKSTGVQISQSMGRLPR